MQSLVISVFSISWARAAGALVYKGVDTALDRPVAIKMLNSEYSRNPELVERFRAEARAQAT